MSSRLRVVQGAPDPGADLRRFPRRTLRAGTVLHRAARHAPWWFCSDGQCRFDLIAPDGTCYLAHDEVGALLELVGPELAGGAVSEEFLAERRLYALTLDADVVVADTTSRRAAGFGVTNELATMADYHVPQAWAKALHQHHFAGVAYRLRFDPGAAVGGIARFGAGGQHDVAPDGHAGPPRPIDKVVRERLQRDCGITIVPRPCLDQLVSLEAVPET